MPCVIDWPSDCDPECPGGLKVGTFENARLADPGRLAGGVDGQVGEGSGFVDC